MKGIRVDRTLANLGTILLGGAGIFTALTGFNVPELNQTFWGENPFAIKRDAIQGVMVWLFSALALVALAIQLFLEILGDDRLPARVHSVRFYAKASAVGFVSVIALVWVLTLAGSALARLSWWPQVINDQREAFLQAAFIAANDGWRPEQREIRASLANPEMYRKINLDQADQIVTQIEALLEVRREHEELGKRIDALKQYFGE